MGQDWECCGGFGETGGGVGVVRNLETIEVRKSIFVFRMVHRSLARGGWAVGVVAADGASVSWTCAGVCLSCCEDWGGGCFLCGCLS